MHHAVRRERYGNRSIGVRKANPGLGHGIQVWRFDGPVAIATEVVGTNGIDSNEYDVRRIVGGGRGGKKKGEDEKRGKEGEYHSPRRLCSAAKKLREVRRTACPRQCLHDPVRPWRQMSLQRVRIVRQTKGTRVVELKVNEVGVRSEVFHEGGLLGCVIIREDQRECCEGEERLQRGVRDRGDGRCLGIG